MKVTGVTAFDQLKIRINDVLHLSLSLNKFVGLQSWQFESRQSYFIELTLEGGVITTEYDSFELWKQVLVELDSLL